MRRRPVCELTASEADAAASFLENALAAEHEENAGSRRLRRAGEKLRAFSLALDVYGEERKRAKSHRGRVSPSTGGGDA